MQQLVEFIARNRFFLVFVLLQVFCFSLIVNSNSYWNVNYFNSANQLASNVLATTNSAREFIHLQDVNTDLANENRLLRQLLVKYQQEDLSKSPIGYKPDSTFAARYRFVTIAKVIMNSTKNSNNYFTINKGTADGIKEGMGVIAPTGIVGKVRFCNDNFSIITSVLHNDNMISAKLTRSGETGTIKWNTNDPSLVVLKDISKNTKVVKGDTVVTSDFNVVFPAGVNIGRVKRIEMSSNLADYDIIVELGTNFRKISYVYLVDNKLLNQQQILDKKLEEENK
jgi:rod shape-determining protein MreC